MGNNEFDHSRIWPDLSKAQARDRQELEQLKAERSSLSLPRRIIYALGDRAKRIAELEGNIRARQEMHDLES